MVMMVMVMMVTVLFLATGLDVFQLQVNHMLSTTTAATTVVIHRVVIAVQVLVTETVTAERLGGQVVPRLDRFYGAVVTPVRRRRLRLDRVLAGRGLATTACGRHRVVVPVQRIGAQGRRVRRRAVLRQTVLVSAHSGR